MCFLQTPKLESFLKPTSESIVACEGQSKAKATEKQEAEKIKPMEACQHSVEPTVQTKPLLEGKILEKDELSTILSKASLWKQVTILHRNMSDDSYFLVVNKIKE